METIIVGLVVSLIQAVPNIVSAINSSGLSEENKKALLDKMETALDLAVDHVANVKFKKID